MDKAKGDRLAVVGLAFLSKKLPRVLTPGLRDLAEAAGLQLVALDPHIALETKQPEQTAQREPAATATGTAPGMPTATIDVIVHKLHAHPVWEAHLGSYTSSHPHVQLLDPPDAIHSTEDRAVMLGAIPPHGGLQLRLPLRSRSGRPSKRQRLQEEAEEGQRQRQGGGTADSDEEDARGVTVSVLAPPQAVVRSRAELEELVASGSGGALHPPLLVKTQRTDAAGGSGHGLAIAASWAELQQRAESLQRQAATPDGPKPSSSEAVGPGGAGGGCGDDGGRGDPWVPLVVQQYIPHSEALYKVYVLGRHVRVTRRATLTRQQLQSLTADVGDPHQQGGPLSAALPDPSLVAPRPAGADGGPATEQSVNGALHDAARPSTAALLQNLSREPLQPPQEPRGAAGQGEAREEPQGQGTASSTEGKAPGAHAPPDSATGGGHVLGHDTDVGADADKADAGAVLDDAMLEAVAHELSLRTRLTMFNFDVVVPEQQPSQPLPNQLSGQGVSHGLQPEAVAPDLHLYVVDVNYFPGYDKLSGWETWLVEHLREAADRALEAKASAAVH